MLITAERNVWQNIISHVRDSTVVMWSGYLTRGQGANAIRSGNVLHVPLLAHVPNSALLLGIRFSICTLQKMRLKFPVHLIKRLALARRDVRKSLLEWQKCKEEERDWCIASCTDIDLWLQLAHVIIIMIDELFFRWQWKSDAFSCEFTTKVLCKNQSIAAMVV